MSCHFKAPGESWGFCYALSMASYLALLRGINVGGNNIIKMSALKECFEKMGLKKVQTFIQSGNVLFSSTMNSAALCARIEKELTKTFNYSASVVVLSERELQKTMDSAPKDFGSEPTKYRYDVLFLKKPLTAKQAIKDLPMKEGVDAVHAGVGALFFSRLVKDITKSRMSKIVMTPIYKQLTIRNWNTTTKLHTLMKIRMQHAPKKSKLDGVARPRKRSKLRGI
jgi:uncharacterized protein (DUF1697 family)